MFEGGIRIPFIARWQGHIPKGRVCSDFCSTLELFPTFTAVAGVKPPKGVILDGFNMLPILTGQAKSVRNEMFWEWRYGRTARVGNWKWVDSPKGGGLFDLSTDISEQHDLSAEKQETIQDIKARWEAWKKEMDESEPRGPFKNY